MRVCFPESCDLHVPLALAWLARLEEEENMHLCMLTVLTLESLLPFIVVAPKFLQTRLILSLYSIKISTLGASNFQPGIYQRCLKSLRNPFSHPVTRLLPFSNP